MNSTPDEVLKWTDIENLQQRHRVRRTPFVRQLVALQEKMLVAA
jgi:hypothetical protein